MNLELKIYLLVNLLVMVTASTSDDLKRVCFVIMSQPHKRHAAIAEEAFLKLKTEFAKFGIDDPKIFVSHKDFPLFGAWTYFPLFSRILEKSPFRIQWFVFVEENAEINLANFQAMISKYNSHYETFLGHEVTDAKPTIVHRFTEAKTGYPDMGAGFVLSRNLVETLAERVEQERSEKIFGNLFLKEYTMDAAFELAQAIGTLNNFDEIRLHHEPQLCQFQGPNCAIYPRNVQCRTSKDDSKKLLQETLFAVKTWSEFHSSRLPFLQATWPKMIKHILYASNVADSKYGTTVLPGAEVNTHRGHCLKTEAILRHFFDRKEFRWLVIADDDTMLGVTKLLELIQCYDEDEEDPVAIGHVYGFRVIRPLGQEKFDHTIEDNKNGGYDYQSGGGGMIFNRRVVEKMLIHDRCKCPTAFHHDDTHLGACLDNLDIPIVRNERFHQARPEDYNASLILRQDPISFHKFVNVDPVKIYEEFFKESDQQLLEYINSQKLEL